MSRGEYFYVVKAAPRTMWTAARPPERRGPRTDGRIVRLFVGQGHGFIRVANDREIFFHRADVHGGASFNDFVVGDHVTFELFDDKVSGARALRIERQRRRS